MRYCERDLQTHAIHGIEQKDAKVLAGCSADAFAFLHSQSIIHRDVKPGTVLIHHEPMATILGDFGVVAACREHQTVVMKG